MGFVVYYVYLCTSYINCNEQGIEIPAGENNWKLNRSAHDTTSYNEMCIWCNVPSIHLPFDHRGDKYRKLWCAHCVCVCVCMLAYTIFTHTHTHDSVPLSPLC